MLFIPQEVKEKLDRLEEDNKKLREENEHLLQEVAHSEARKKKPVLNYWTIGALVVAIVYILDLQFGSNRSEQPEPKQEDLEAVLIADGKIAKWNAASMEDVVYRVQLGAYEGFDLDRYKQNLDGLHQDSIDGYRKVSLGAFTRLKDAQSFLEELVRMTMQNVYIVAYRNNEPIGLIEAKQLEN